MYSSIIRDKVEELIKIRNISDGWKLQNKGQIFSHSTIQYAKLELPLNKIEGVFPTNFEKTSNYFQECYENKERNEMCGSLQLKERIDQDTIVAYLLNKGKFIFSPRELIIVQNRHLINKDEVLITRTSIDNHNSVLSNPDAVRAEAKIYGIFLKKLNDYQTKFEAYLIIDLKGNIPNFANNMMIDKYLTVFENDISYIKQH